MAQHTPRHCPRCGTPAAPNQRFCAECGTVLDAEVNRPTSLISEGQQAQLAAHPQPNTEPPAPTMQIQSMPTSVSSPYEADQSYPTLVEGQEQQIPPPPPPIYQPSRTPAPQPYIPPAPAITSPPAYASKPKRSRGCLVFSLVLLLVLVAGSVGAYFVFFRPSGNAQSNHNSQSASTHQNTPVITSNTPVLNNNTPTAANSTPTPSATATANGATSEQLNLKFIYAGIDHTITSVQYAQSYPDDGSITSGGVRVSFNEDNTTSKDGNYSYSDAARLILPGGNAIAPSNVKHGSSTQAQTTDTNWLDFPLASPPADLSQLVLQMGTAQENQMQIPLSPGADLSKYQAKTITPNTPFQYAGLDWTLTSATQSLSVAGQQATNGNVYVAVALKIFNPTQAPYSAYYGDYARLQAGSSTTSPTSDTTFPTSVDSQATANGTLIFLVPQGNTSYTLLMLGFSSNPPVKAVSVNFQIQ